MTPEEIVDRWAFTGMYPNNIRKVVSLSQDVVAKLKNGAEKQEKGKEEELMPISLKRMRPCQLMTVMTMRL